MERHRSFHTNPNPKWPLGQGPARLKPAAGSTNQFFHVAPGTKPGGEQQVQGPQAQTNKKAMVAVGVERRNMGTGVCQDRYAGGKGGQVWAQVCVGTVM